MARNKTQRKEATTPAVRSTSGGNWLFINHQLFRGGWARKLGVYAVAVYNVLAMHANAQQRAWPSYQTIADMTGMSKRQAIRVVQQLANYHIVAVSSCHDPNGNQATNVFTLLAPSAWICPGMAAQDASRDVKARATRTTRTSPPPSDSQSLPPVTHTPKNASFESPPPVTHSHPNKNQLEQKTTNKKQENNKTGDAPDTLPSLYADAVVALLTEIGVVGSKLSVIVAAAPPLEYVEAWVRYAQTQALTNPAGFVVKQILNNVSPPQTKSAEQRSRAMTAREIWEELQAEENSTVCEPGTNESQEFVTLGCGDVHDRICSSSLANASIAPNLSSPGTRLWTMALHDLRKMVLQSVFAEYLTHSHAVGLSDHTLIVAVANERAQDWLARRLMRWVLDVLSGIDSTVTAVQFVVAAEYEQSEEPLRWDLPAMMPITFAALHPAAVAA